MPDVNLRPATLEDESFLFDHRNGATVIASSAVARAVSPKEHQSWFTTSLQSLDRRIMIIESDGETAGQVRLDRDGPDEVVSIAISESFRGRGVAVHALALIREFSSRDLVARIRDTNSASLTSFRRAGFECSDHSDGFIVMRLSRLGKGSNESEGDEAP